MVYLQRRTNYPNSCVGRLGDCLFCTSTKMTVSSYLWKTISLAMWKILTLQTCRQKSCHCACWDYQGSVDLNSQSIETIKKFDVQDRILTGHCVGFEK